VLELRDHLDRQLPAQRDRDVDDASADLVADRGRVAPPAREVDAPPAVADAARVALDEYEVKLDAALAAREAELEAASSLSVAEVERRSLDLARLKDANWAIRNDRLRNAVAVFDLAGTGATDSARNAYFSIQQAFAALDRMEVRGRDSAGVHVMVWGHGLEATDSRVAPLLVGRQDDVVHVTLGARGCTWLRMVVRVQGRS
ncbi:MAG: hypothetical protein RIQ63_1239, partial [Actinomycetota bacterium]